MRDFYRVRKAGVPRAGQDKGEGRSRDARTDDDDASSDDEIELSMSGSMLANMAKQFNEEELAVEELERAKEEAREGPKRMEVDLLNGRLVQQEEQIRAGIVGESWPTEGCEDRNVAEVDEKDKVTKPVEPLESSWRYPKPWPTIPFSYETERIQRHIPLRDLPKKLIVHDPWNLVAVDETNRYGRAQTTPNSTDWSAGDDIRHVYNLHVSPSAAEYRGEEFGEAVDQKEEGFVVALPSASSPSKNSPPSVFVAHEPKPSGMEEAHLYLSPVKKCGNGHHSVLWFAEWELPRSYFFPDSLEERYVLCRECVSEDAVRILAEEAATGMTEAEEGQDVEVGEVSSDRSKEDVEGEIEGPIRRIQTTVKWQDALRPTCPHLTSREPAESTTPPSVKVRVAAKLSLGGDGHLLREARNYQCFPEHFFQHWSGLNLLDDMEDPVPLGPIVPQFYGYYLPERSEERGMGYRSGIMLLEDCGSEVDFSGLTTDERNEAASLWFRFHHAGWRHHSPFPRNMVAQAGPLSVPRSERVSLEDDDEKTRQISFRLIDFGRSHAPGVPTSYGFTPNFTETQEVDAVEEICGLR